MTYEQIILIIYIAYILLSSIMTFLLFCKDKKIAVKGADRIKEKTLLSFVVFGGAIGGFIGRLVARHKTDKVYFSFTIYLSILLQAITAAVLIFLAI